RRPIKCRSHKGEEPPPPRIRAQPHLVESIGDLLQERRFARPPGAVDADGDGGFGHWRGNERRKRLRIVREPESTGCRGDVASRSCCTNENRRQVRDEVVVVADRHSVQNLTDRDPKWW